RVRQRLGRLDADQQRTHEPRPARHGDAVQVGEPDARVGDGAPEHGRDGRDVLARRDLGHDAAVLGVHEDLGRDDVGAHAPTILDDGRRRLVARGLDPQDQHSLRGFYHGDSTIARRSAAYCPLGRSSRYLLYAALAATLSPVDCLTLPMMTYAS